MEIKLALMCGIDFPIPECQIIMHQPSIKEIGFMGEENFFIAVQTLCVDKKMLSQGKSLLDDVNNFQIFMMIMSEKETANKKINVQQLFQLILPNYKVSFTPRSLLITGNDVGMTQIDDRNFEYLQKAVSQMFCLDTMYADQRNYNPANEAANEIAQKLMRGRQRVAAEKGEVNSSVISQYLSVLTVGIPSMSLNDLTNLTLYQFYDLIERYNLYINWDIDIRSRMAGAKPESKPDNWMKSIH